MDENHNNINQNIEQVTTQTSLNNEVTQQINNNEKLQEIEKNVTKINTKYHKTRISNFALKMSFLYKPRNIWVYISISALVGFLFGVISLFFVKNTGLYNFGIAAIGQGIAKITVALLPVEWALNNLSMVNAIDQSIFWFLYMVISIPLFIFSYKKLGKKFTLITLVFLLAQNIGGFVIGIIPGTSGFLFFGSVIPADIAAQSQHLPNEIFGVLPIRWTDGGQTIVMFLYAFLYGIILAVVFAVIAITGATAGVSGIIGEWYSQAKNKSFATISGYMNLAIMVVSIFIGSYLSGSIILSRYADHLALHGVKLSNSWNFDLYLSPNFVATFISNYVFVVFMNQLYPRYKFVKVEIYSRKMSEVRNAILRDKKTVNSLTIYESRGGYSLEKQSVLVSIALFSHVPRMMKRVHQVDPDAFVAVIRIRNIEGNVYMPVGKF